MEKLYSILLSDDVYTSIKENEDYLFSLIPDLQKCVGFNQYNKWHVYDVYEHILNVVKNTPKDLTLRLAALFHDIGKIYTLKIDDNKVGHFYNHWAVSNDIFLFFVVKYGIDKDLAADVSKLIYFHDIVFSSLTEEKQKEIINYLGPILFAKLYDLKKADLLSQNEEYHYLLDNYENERQRLLKLMV